MTWMEGGDMRQDSRSFDAETSVRRKNPATDSSDGAPTWSADETLEKATGDA